MATFQYNYVFTLMKFVLYLSLSSLLLFPWKRSHALGYMKFDLTLTTKVFDRPYAAQIFLGVPAQKMFLAIDMGSDLVRFSCGIKQGHETMPPAETKKDTMPPGDDITGSGLPGLVYNVNESSTFLHVFCNSTGLCPPRFQANRPAGNCSSETYCTLPTDKPDRSNTMYLSTDILNTNGIDFFNFMFACDPYDIYEFTVSKRGVLGLGRSEPSFFQQFGSMYDNCLSYCLPVDSTSTGYLAFGLVNNKCPGDDDMSSLVLTDLSVHPNYPSSYLIHITSITVNTTQISINSSSSDQSGMLVNPATFFTTLPMGLYQAMRDEFKEQNNSTVVDFYGAYVSGGMLDLCFNTSEGAAAINIPRVSMTFANDATVELDGEHGIIYVYDSNKSCLGFMGNEDPHAPGVLGGMQQAKLKVGIDVANQKVGFRRKSSCS